MKGVWGWTVVDVFHWLAESGWDLPGIGAGYPDLNQLLDWKADPHGVVMHQGQELKIVVQQVVGGINTEL